MPTLDWIGKKAVLNHHQTVPYRLLRGDPKSSVGDSDSANLLVEGDNLESLKALLPYYARQAKCIYIDPPYNTGNERWVYNDAVGSPEIRAWLGRVVGREAEDLSRHDKWLCMMYPRLVLLREFLHPDGALFVSISDIEIGHMRLLLDEILSPQRFVATIVWQKRYSRENREAIGDVHEYILVYARDPERFKRVRNRVPMDEKSAKVYKTSPESPLRRWRAIPMTAQGYRPNQMYPVTTPSGKVVKPPKDRCWSLIEPEFLKLREAGRIWFGKKGNAAPGVIRYLDEVEGLVPWTWWPHDEVGHTDEAKKEVAAFAGAEAAFDTPKPERLLRRIIEIATSPGDLVLDAFAGSGTTGAVAQKLRRRWILCELESFARTLAAKRLKSVCAGEDAGGVSKSLNWAGGGGFSYCTLGPTLFDSSGRVNDTVRFADLAQHVFFTETGTPAPPRARESTSPLIGTFDSVAYYLLFNGILGDRRPDGGNILTSRVLADLPRHGGPRVVFGEGCRLGAARLKNEGVTFRQIPYQIKT